MLNKKLLLSIAVIGSALVTFAGFSRPYRWWPFVDMAETPVIKPFNENSLLQPAEGSVSVDQWNPVPLKTDPQTLEQLVNPIEATEASLAKGKALYDTYCWACHGTEMAPTPDKMSPVAMKGMPAANIHLVKLRSDQSIYSTITHGNAIMMRLDYHLSPEERWHVVNYVRGLANKYQDQ